MPLNKRQRTSKSCTVSQPVENPTGYGYQTALFYYRCLDLFEYNKAEIK